MCWNGSDIIQFYRSIDVRIILAIFNFHSKNVRYYEKLRTESIYIPSKNSCAILHRYNNYLIKKIVHNF